MAYREKNRTLIRLNTLAQILYSVKFFRFAFFFYAFLSFVFWFMNCLEVDWLYLFNWLFVVPYSIVAKFYTPQGVSADFSLAIIGGIALVLGFIFDFTCNNLYDKILLMEEEEERKIKQRRMKEKRENKKQVLPVAPSDTVPFENSKLLFLILPHANKIKRKKNDLELTFQEVELWKQRINKKLIENISYSKPMQKGYYRKNLFLMYKDFNYADDFVYFMKPTLDSIKLEFRKYGISVAYSYVLSALTDLQMLEKELDCMDTILSLNFVNETIVTNRFKVTYDNKATQKNNLQLKGEYNLSKNLTVTNRQPLYSLVDKKAKGDK